MPDREKVIKNLQIVVNICALNGDIQSMRTIDDAIALLKEQGVQKVVYTINPFTGLSVSYCPKCGKPIDMFRAGVDVPVRFCGYCGQEVAWNA